jgi:mRNA interferase MazF
MGYYSPGDILLLPVDLGGVRGKKTRPALVVGTDGDQFLLVCPISRHPPGDDVCLPLDLEDFAVGGLDLFAGSYILTALTCRIRKSEVIGKKGRLTRKYMDAITHIRRGK